MFHLVKKNFARLQQPLSPSNVPNGEYADLRQRLASIKAALKYTLSMLNSSNRIWILQIQQQRQFSEKFHEAYPSTRDDTYTVAKHFAEESQALYDQFTRDAEQTSAVYFHIYRQIHTYIQEIERVESRYPQLNATKAESSRYQSKLDAMQRNQRRHTITNSQSSAGVRGRAGLDGKEQRNLMKLERVRDEYRSLLREVVRAQKETYGKHPVVFKAALAAYWLSHEKHVTALVHSLEKTKAFATAYESELEHLDIANLRAADIAKLSSVDTATVLLQQPTVSISSPQLNMGHAAPLTPDGNEHNEFMPLLSKRASDDIAVRDGAGRNDDHEFEDAKQVLPVTPTTPAPPNGHAWGPVTQHASNAADNACTTGTQSSSCQHQHAPSKQLTTDTATTSNSTQQAAIVPPFTPVI